MSDKDIDINLNNLIIKLQEKFELAINLYKIKSYSACW